MKFELSLIQKKLKVVLVTIKENIFLVLKNLKIAYFLIKKISKIVVLKVHYFILICITFMFIGYLHSDETNSPFSFLFFLIKEFFLWLEKEKLLFYFFCFCFIAISYFLLKKSKKKTQ